MAITKTKYPGVYKLEDGRFLIKVARRQPATGKLVFRKRTLDAGLCVEEAVLARAEFDLSFKHQLEAGEDEERQEEKMAPRRSLTEYALGWCERKEARWKASYQAHVADVLGTRILTVMGELVATEITRADVEAWVVEVEGWTTQRGRSYARETLHSWWRMLGSLLRDLAAEFGMVDPMLRVRPPQSVVRGVREKRTLSAEQLGTLLSSVRTVFPDWYAEVYMLAFTGMRPGELYALTWDEVDEDRGCIRLERAVWRGHVGTTKTDDPREVALTDEMQSVLRAHRAKLERVAHRGVHTGHLFPAINGKARSSNAVCKVLRLASEHAKLGFRAGPQVLRRSFNTLLVEAGVDRLVLRSQMGHASEEMTARYAGVHVSAKVGAVERLRQLVPLPSQPVSPTR